MQTTIGIEMEIETRLGFGETLAISPAVKLQAAGRIRPALTSRFDWAIAFQAAF